MKMQLLFYMRMVFNQSWFLQIQFCLLLNLTLTGKGFKTSKRRHFNVNKFFLLQLVQHNPVFLIRRLRCWSNRLGYKLDYGEQAA